MACHKVTRAHATREQPMDTGPKEDGREFILDLIEVPAPGGGVLQKNCTGMLKV